ncbi:MAG: M18 family aminopeptidase [Acholeplasmatales bacterium]|nr:M18 family aminopeptidase [Acholeplasmatales bacterium]
MEFLDFLQNTPTAFHAVKEFKDLLLKQNYVELQESKLWNLEKSGKYFFTRNNSTIVAFSVSKDISDLSYNIVAAHTDSPTFKIKPNNDLKKGEYHLLNTEIYGGPILNTWLDRRLNIAGRVIVKEDGKLVTKLLSFDRGVVVIPNCSIHYYHELNDGVKLNPQNELVPLLTEGNKNLMDLVAEKLNVKKEDIVSHDLYLASLDRGGLFGADNEYMNAPQIDNLECSFAGIKALTAATPKSGSVNVCVLFDNEEIGSRTRQGAGSKILADTLRRISLNLGLTEEAHIVALNNSFLISADNAQGFHPNYAHKYDPTNACYMNKGIAIKNAARGSYTTDALSLAYFTEICKKAGSKYQLNTNRSDVPGGGTLGAISLSQVSIPSVDIGLPQISMHSIMETAGVNDYFDLEKALKEFYSNHFSFDKDGIVKF